jgi:hypothetical protein
MNSNCKNAREIFGSGNSLTKENETKQIELFHCESSTSSVLEMSYVYGCDNLFGISQMAKFGMAGKKRKSDDEVNEKYCFRQILRLNGGSRCQCG